MQIETRVRLPWRGSYARLLPHDIAQYTIVAKLPRGDCLILSNDHPTVLVERKTISDLSASLYDGRIQRQLGCPARFPTFLLVEDPQLLLIHECQLFQAVLNEVSKGNVSSIIQSVSAEHTARIYEYLFRSTSDLLGVDVSVHQTMLILVLCRPCTLMIVMIGTASSEIFFAITHPASPRQL